MRRHVARVITLTYLYLYSCSPLSAAFLFPVAVRAKNPPSYASSLDSDHSRNALEPQFHFKGKNGDYSAVIQELSVRSAECQSLRRATDDKNQAFSTAAGVLETNQNDLLVKISDLVTALNEARRVMTVAETKLDKTKAELAEAQRRIKVLEESLRQKDAVSIPELYDWYLDGDGAICGTVSNHPEIEDGTTILTSPLENTSNASEHCIVTTLSGSSYKLLSPLDCEASELVEDTVGNGKYLLVGTPRNSAAGRSQIWSALHAGSEGVLVGEAPLVVKVSSNRLAMEREWENYQRVRTGFNRGLIVSPVEFLFSAGSSVSLAHKCALVMERGVHGDVKEYLSRRGEGGLKGPALWNATFTAAQCTQVMHSSKLVWTDLKVENFVVVQDEDGSFVIKAIDMESAIERGGTPVDFSPESCPPEFAAAFLSGEGQDFVLDYSYDIWSLGTFFYELSTGRGPFDGMNPSEITHQLPTYQPDMDCACITDPNLMNLISQCLQLDPKKRPTITEVLNHPYFSTE